MTEIYEKNHNSKQSQFCQFCDKELLFAFSVVSISGYITCGAEPCVAKAIRNTKHYDKLQREKEQPPIIESEIILFSTKNPHSPGSWRIVPPEDHPDFMDDLEVVAGLLDGLIANILKPNQKDMLYYRAETVKVIKKQLGAKLNA